MVVRIPTTSYSASARRIRASACGAVVAPGDQLRDQRVVVDRDLAALGGAAVVADARALRHPQAGDAARRRQEAGVGILGVDAALDGVAARREQRLGIEREPLAPRDPDLPLHQVDAGDHLGDRMLDLQPGVHLEEVERAVLVEQELDRAGVGVADRRATAAAAAVIRRRVSAVIAGDGLSSITFWCRR